MDEKLTHEQLQARITEASKFAEVGASYKHYKSPDTYRVVGFGIIEATQEACVMYQPEHGGNITFIRPFNQWLEEVEWNGAMVKRFTKI